LARERAALIGSTSFAYVTTEQRAAVTGLRQASAAALIGARPVVKRRCSRRGAAGARGRQHKVDQVPVDDGGGARGRSVRPVAPAFVGDQPAMPA
jgi:hypothetical protein